jgi:3-methyladenine DNA glycosylase/8-oxoguanine DNA glycosylase
LRKALGNSVPASERETAEAAEAWRPWRGYAAMYLWSSLAALESEKATKKKEGRHGTRAN